MCTNIHQRASLNTFVYLCAQNHCNVQKYATTMHLCETVYFCVQMCTECATMLISVHQCALMCTCVQSTSQSATHPSSKTKYIPPRCIKIFLLTVTTLPVSQSKVNMKWEKYKMKICKFYFHLFFNDQGCVVKTMITS